MTLSERVGVDPTWGLDAAARLTGPWSAFHRVPAHTTVTIIDAALVPPGEQTGSVEVSESAYGTFTVEQWQHDGLAGVRHGRTGNRIAWTPDRRSWFVTRPPEDAAVTPQSWVHARYVLRHAIVSTLLEQGHDCLHGLAVTYDGEEGAAVLIAGATLSGKTRLANRLIERDALADVVEDDCVVLGADGGVRALMPTQHELRRLQIAEATAVVELRFDVDEVADAEPADVRARLAATPLSWPVRWLPGPVRSPSIAGIADHLPCLAVPARSDDDATVDAVVEWLLTVL